MTELPNITYHGFTALHSPLFAKILNQCGAIVYPSASEGGAGSVIAASHGSLVRIAPESAAVDMDENSVLLPDISEESVRDAIMAVASWTPQELEARARATWEWANANHTREQFSKRYRAFAETVSREQLAL